jgi:hypothetical protein
MELYLNPICAYGSPAPILVVMELVILAFLLLIGPLAVRYGADSRVTDTRDRRGPWRTG